MIIGCYTNNSISSPFSSRKFLLFTLYSSQHQHRLNLFQVCERKDSQRALEVLQNMLGQFSANKLMLSPAGEVVQGFALRRPTLKRPKQAKPLGAQRPTHFWWGAQTPVAEGQKNLLSLKAANSHLWWSGVAFVVFMIGWWSNRLSAIDCSNSAAFFTAEQIFLKAWKARAFSFTPTYREEPFFVAQIFQPACNAVNFGQNLGEILA